MKTKSGPFQIIWSELPEDAQNLSVASPVISNPSSHNPSSHPIRPSSHPIRIYECEHYQSCLEVAAALNWESFACNDCDGTTCDGNFNTQLVWKAHVAQRDDKVAKKLCALPEITCFEALEPESSDQAAGDTPLIRARKIAQKK